MIQRLVGGESHEGPALGVARGQIPVDRGRARGGPHVGDAVPTARTPRSARQLLPNAGIEELEITAYGRTPLTRDTLHWLPEVLVGSLTRIVGPHDTRMALTTNQTWEPAPAAGSGEVAARYPKSSGNRE